MKSLAGGAIHENGIAKVEDALRFAMTLPVATVCSGMDSLEYLHKNLKTAREFKPMTEADITTLLTGVIKYSINGKYEDYKTYTPESGDEKGDTKES